jgi:hypothetical protein
MCHFGLNGNNRYEILFIYFSINKDKKNKVMYYIVKVRFTVKSDRTGKLIKVIEEYLVDGESISNAEEKVKVSFKDCICEDFNIIEVKESKIMGIIK